MAASFQTILLFVCGVVHQTSASTNWELIYQHKDVNNGLFSSQLTSTGLENENDPTSNTYSIIGWFTDGTMDQTQYYDNNYGYKFKLTYDYFDGSNSEIIWTQTSWITASSVTGADLSLIPDQSAKPAKNRFYGLAISSHSWAWLDGSPAHGNWYHAIGINTCWNNPCGIPGDRTDLAAEASSLYIWNPNPATSTPTNSPTLTPTLAPTLAPTNSPTMASTSVLVKSNACFSATSYESGYTFNPPYNGEIIGIRLVHQSGSVNCDYSRYVATNWGCEHNSNMITVQMIEHDGDSVYYPTSTTEGVYSFDPWTCSNGNACGVNKYYMTNYGVNDNIIEFRDELNPYLIDTSQTFSLQYSEGCCGSSIGDNSGTSCADVYFMYSDIISTDPTTDPTAGPTNAPSLSPTLTPTGAPSPHPFDRYEIGPNPVSYSEGQQYCNSIQQTLAIIRNTDNNNVVQSLCDYKDPLQSNGCWIGLYKDTQNDNKWKWDDDGDNDYMLEYLNIDPQLPIITDFDNNCVGITGQAQGNKWKSDLCNDLKYPICDHPTLNPTVSPTNEPSVSPTFKPTQPTSAPTSCTIETYCLAQSHLSCASGWTHTGETCGYETYDCNCNAWTCSTCYRDVYKCQRIVCNRRRLLEI